MLINKNQTIMQHCHDSRIREPDCVRDIKDQREEDYRQEPEDPFGFMNHLRKFVRSDVRDIKFED
jgi:hypothetical protein